MSAATSRNVKIVFTPSGRQGEVATGTNLLQAPAR